MECLSSHLNSVKPSIQITLEHEKDRHLPFLDFNVYRGEQRNFEMSVYRKPNHTDKYLTFDSHHPICHKKSVAKTLPRRADCLPSSLNFKAEDGKYVSLVLNVNGYPKTFLHNCRKLVTTSSTPDEREPVTSFAVIPYIQGVTEPIKRILNSHNVKVAQKPFQTVGHIFANAKGPVTKEQWTNTVYSIPCNDCDHKYIRLTKHRFGTHLKEHQKAVFFCKKETLALSEHTCPTNYTIGWDKSKIITTNQHCHQCLCLEAWHINSAHAPLNHDDATYLLTPIYTQSEKRAAN